MQQPQHKSVLLSETVDGLKIRPDGIYVDATMGGGGHSEEILKRLDAQGTFIGIDQDDYAQKRARERLKDYPAKKFFVKDNFKNLRGILSELGIDKIDGIVFDLGVSSFQFDDSARGFSYHHEGPLDMRMDRQATLSAAEVVNTYEKEDLIKILKEYGEERFAARIAQKIIENRPIATTTELSELVKEAYPKKMRFKGKHPARKTFQALRIATNDELGILEGTLRESVRSLKPGGRLCVISFHSLEDRIVKNVFKELSDPCTCPPDFPVCVCGKKPLVDRITRKPLRPSQGEIDDNKRSRSALLRIVERTENPWIKN